MRAHWRAHPGVLELSRQFPPSAAGAVARHGLALVEELGVARRHALECYRSLSWTVTGFVILEQTLDQSVHHRRVGPTRWVLDLDDGAPPSSFDTDSCSARRSASPSTGWSGASADRQVVPLSA